MDLQLFDSVTLVTGSSRGIGKSIAESLLKEGGRVVITGRSEDSLTLCREEFEERFGADKILAIQADFTKTADIERVVREIGASWGSLNAVVCNVGSGSFDCDWKPAKVELQKSLDINFFSTTETIRLTFPFLVKNANPSIVAISSIAGIEYLGAPLSYSVAKAALNSYIKNLASSFGEHGIRVNCVAPGNILFEGGRWEEKLTHNKDEINEYIAKNVPLKRFGSTIEVANAVVFLISNRASFVTGACLVVDGGQSKSL